MTFGSIRSTRQAVALLVVGLMVLVPAGWIGWSLTAASAVAETNRTQAETLESLQARLSALSAGTNAAANAASVFLPGETAAIAGAALQRLVSDTVEGAGGRLAESEISRPQGEAEDAEPGAVSLRVSFETDVAGLQRIVFALETGAPILTVRTLGIETKDVAAEVENPMLNVVMLVSGYREA